jgi:hypothetical protein
LRRTARRAADFKQADGQEGGALRTVPGFSKAKVDAQTFFPQLRYQGKRGKALFGDSACVFWSLNLQRDARHMASPCWTTAMSGALKPL